MKQYDKNLTEDLRLRLAPRDMDFLRTLSEERACSVSEVIRSIIGEYRRSVDTIKTLSDALNLAREKGAGLSYGDTKTDINDKL